MDFSIPEDLRQMVDTVRRFVKKELDPISRQVEEEDQLPEEVVQRMRDLGLFGVSIPKQYGGLGLGALGVSMVVEEKSRPTACIRPTTGR